MPPSLHLSLSGDWQGSGQLWPHCWPGNSALCGHQTGQHQLQVCLWQLLVHPLGKLVSLSCLGDLHLAFVDTWEITPPSGPAPWHPLRMARHLQQGGLAPLLHLPHLSASVGPGTVWMEGLGHSCEEDQCHNRISRIRAGATDSSCLEDYNSFLTSPADSILAPLRPLLHSEQEYLL